MTMQVSCVISDRLGQPEPMNTMTGTPGPVRTEEQIIGATLASGSRVGGIATSDDNTSRIQGALVGLARLGIEISTFTYPAISRQCLTTEQFLKLARAITDHTDEDVLKQALSLGVKVNLYDLPCDINVQTFIQLCSYLKSASGQRALQDAQRTIKLTKKGISVQPANVVALTTVLQIQLQDMSNAIKETKKDYDNKILDLRTQLALLEEKRDKAIRRGKRKFKPANAWSDINVHDFKRACYRLYRAWCNEEGTIALPEGDISYLLATQKFGDQVRLEEMRKFCYAEGHREKLTKYLEEKIQYFDSKRNRRQADIFRNYMAVITGRSIGAAPARVEEETSSATPETSRLESENLVDEAAIGDNAEEAAAGTAPKGVRKSGLPRKPRKDKSVEVVAKRARKKHPNRKK